MPGVLPVLREGPATYQVASAVTGGNILIPNTITSQGTDATVKPCTTGSSPQVLGVAANDAAPYVDQTGLNPVVISQQPDRVAVYYDVDIPVHYSAACNFALKLISDTTSGVAPYSPVGSTYDIVIGICTEPGGVAAAGTFRAFVSCGR